MVILGERQDINTSDRIVYEYISVHTKKMYKQIYHKHIAYHLEFVANLMGTLRQTRLTFASSNVWKIMNSSYVLKLLSCTSS